MKCNEAIQRWHLRLETNGDDAALYEHISSCTTCRVFADEMTTVLDKLDDLRQATEPLGPVATSHYSERHAIRHRSWVGVVVRIAALIAIVAIGGMYYSSSSDITTVSEIPATLVDTTPDIKTEDPDKYLGLSLQGKSAKRYLAVAQVTSDPTVHLYTLYPTFNKE